MVGARRRRQTEGSGPVVAARGEGRPSGPLRVFLKRRTSDIGRIAERAYGRTRANEARVLRKRGERPIDGSNEPTKRQARRKNRSQRFKPTTIDAASWDADAKDRFLTGRNPSPFSGIGTYRWTCGLVGADVMKFPAHSEKLKDVRLIGRVQRVHSPLYKCSIEVRGAFMAPNGNNLGIENPVCNGIYPTFSRDPHLVL